MIVFRWVLGVIGALLVIAMAISFAIAIGFDNAVWMERTRRVRHWVWLILMFWFNTEVWGSVARTIWYWNRGSSGG